MINSSFRSAQDGLEIFTYDWPTDGDAAAVVQISHGLAEHAPRYARLAAGLNAAGYHVAGNDHRGHGGTITEIAGDLGPAGFTGLWEDMAQYGSQLRAAHPGKKLFLLAHSMGSFAAQNLLPTYSQLYDGVVLSGTTAIDVMAANMADAPAADLSVFNAAFEFRTGYEWLSRDEGEVDAYVADPLCGFALPPETTPALFADGARLADPAVLGKIRADLPILIISGSEDPLAGGGPLPELVGSRYRESGLKDVTVKVYPGARHEVYNEINRNEVTADVVSWLNARTAS